MFNFITTGCSFSAGTISLPHDTAEDWRTRGSIWNHFCFAEMDPSKNKFVNLALSGGSNISATANLIYYLETHKPTVTNQNTLIGINLTGLNRYDTVCSLDDPNINVDLCCIDPRGIDHPSKELGFGWVSLGNNHRIPHAEILNCLSLLQCFCYLESNNFNYFFMLMNDSIYTRAPQWFKTVLDQRTNRWITFDGVMGMMEFVLKHNLARSAKDHHPSIDGNKLIAEYVLEFLEKNNYAAFLSH